MERYSLLSTDITRIDVENKLKYYRTMVVPDIPVLPDDIYVITTYGDRLDLLSYQYYGDSSLWFIIAACNPTAVRKDSMMLESGLQLRISRSADYVIGIFIDANN